MNRDEYNYWLGNINNIGARKIEWLLEVFGNAEEVYRAPRDILMAALALGSDSVGAKPSEENIETLIRNREAGRTSDDYAKLMKSGIEYITKEDSRYPSKLKEIYSAPYALYVKGSLPEQGRTVLAVVGARECSPYGKEMARFLAGAVAGAGIAIISGLARGIDSYAHEGALASGGITYGVLGCGIDICYPKENINLYMEMQKTGGIISEYAPGMQPLAANFPMRNRIISGLSDGILVIEAKEKSGSLITVDMGLDQGRDIYALPGRSTDRLSEGCNNLIKMGAKLVTTPKDILEELIPGYEQKADCINKDNNRMNKQERIIYDSLSLEPLHIEQISLQTGITMDLLMEQLLLLEIRGLARQSMKNYYVVA